MNQEAKSFLFPPPTGIKKLISVEELGLEQTEPLIEAIIDERCWQDYLDKCAPTEAAKAFLAKVNKKS